MTLGHFIQQHHREIIGEFSAFARTLVPQDSQMTDADLRDHAAELLTGIAQDLATAQSPDEETRKSRGLGTANVMAASGRLHADGRIGHGFTPAQVLAEFRALRATVLRLYEPTGGTDMRGVRRFNEAIDEALTESATRYAAQTDLYRNQFIGILSHDLRTPLNSITAGAGLMAGLGRDDQRQAMVAAQILNSANRMGRMIADLLDLTHTRLSGAIPISRGPADLRRVCDEVIMELRASHADVLVRFESSGDLLGEWDSDRLAQLVSNLVGNAIQHGAGSPVTLTALEVGDQAVLSVHNSGSPIAPSAQRAIFEPLVRGAPQSAGIGLGLFIARAIAIAHGGAISVTSSQAEGTTFTVLLPLRSIPHATDESHPGGSSRRGLEATRLRA